MIENVATGGVDDAATYDVFKKTQMQWVKSPFVLGRAARKPEMVKLTTMREHKDDPVGYLESKITVDYPGDAELMRVAIKGTHRDDLATIVNSVVEAYMEEIVAGDKMARLKQRDLLNEHYSKNKVQYRDKAASYHELAKQLGANSSETAQMRKKLLMMKLESLIASRNALKNQIRDYDFKIEVLKQDGAKPTEPAAAPPEAQSEAGRQERGLASTAAPASDSNAERIAKDELPSDAGIAELNRRIADLKLMIKEQQYAVTPAVHFSVRGLLRQLADLEEKIEQRKSELQAAMVAAAGGKADPKQPAADTTEVDAMLPLLETELKELEKSLATANQQIELQMQGADRSKSSILVAGTGEHEVPLAGLDAKGKARWSLKLSAPVANLATRADKPWLALALRDGNVRVVDLAAGNELGMSAGRGRRPTSPGCRWPRANRCWSSRPTPASRPIASRPIDAQPGRAIGDRVGFFAGGLPPPPSPIFVPIARQAHPANAPSTASTLAGRSTGSLARQARTIRSRSAGTSDCRCEGGTTGSRTWAISAAIPPRWGKGGCPVSR